MSQPRTATGFWRLENKRKHSALKNAGVQVSSSVVSGGITASGNPLQIGGDSIYGQYFQGTIDEVRVYNRALSQTEIQADMNVPVTP